MCPDPMQFLTYMAAKTKTIKLGSMVVVLPWHDLSKNCQQFSLLDTLSNGRLILGLGRGLVEEFDAFRTKYGRLKTKVCRERRMRFTSV